MNRERGFRKALFEVDDTNKHVWELGGLSQNTRGSDAGSNPFRCILGGLTSSVPHQEWL